MGKTEETSQARAMRLSEEVGRLLPELEPHVARAVISSVVEQATGLTNEVESHFQVAKKKLDAAAVVSVMVQGALAVICESHADGDVRDRLYKAGRAVGEFITERWQAKIENEVEAKRKATES